MMDTPTPPPNEEVVQPQAGRLKWMVLGLVALALVILLATIVGVFFAFDAIRRTIETTSLNIPLFAEESLKNHIAFVGNDNNLWLVAPDGANLHSITSDGRGYNFPTWAPDGRRLAFVGQSQANRPALFISPISGSAPIEVFNKHGSSPFYLYWAPNSNSITFLTQESSGLAMRQIDTRMPDEDITLGEGVPFYWVWSPQSDKMLLHVGGSRQTSEKAHISILENQRDAKRIQLDLAPGRFQAPVWSADGKFFYYIAANGDGQESIYKANAKTLEQTLIINLDGSANIVLAPDNRRIAYTQLERGLRPPFGKAYLVDTDGQNHKLITEEPVASMYWSPNGKKLALLSISRASDGPTAKVGALASPLPQELLLRWWIYDVEAGTLEPLISFSPTRTFLQTIPFYDQYHLSLTFWSPDSRYFVITKESSNHKGGTVWVVDSTGEEDPRQVGEGTLAVWSWQ
jgi:dipeptidyl aminopeptidase/acylaminoacyl peptidase